MANFFLMIKDQRFAGTTASARHRPHCHTHSIEIAAKYVAAFYSIH
ncbi:hypothetical protein ACVBEF_11535 [Glaciimonas sp. GG7]